MTGLPRAEELALVALDLDGTVICPSGSQPIRPRVKQAINTLRRQGVPVTFVTGRTEDYAAPIAHRFGLTTPLVTYNGARIYCPKTKNFLFKARIEAEMTPPLLDFLERLPEVVACYFDTPEGLHLVQNRCSGSPAHDDHLFGKERQITGTLADQGSRLSKVILAADQARQDEIAARFGDQIQVVRTHPELVELLPGGVSKGAGVQRLCQALEISLEQVLAVGDQENDISTFQSVGFSVAMGSSPPQVLKAARWTTGSFEEDGCAQVLEALYSTT